MTLTLKNLFPAAILGACLAANSAQSAPVKFMAVGDSITEGYNPNPAIGAASYRQELEALLTQDGCSFEMVGSRSTNYSGNPTVFTGKHEGYSGRKVNDLRDGTNNNPGIDAMMQTQTPDVILFHGGSNDMNGGDSIPGTVVEITDVISRILNSNGNAVIFVANVIPWHNDNNNQWNPDIEGSVQILGTQIETAIAALGNSNVILVDVRTGFLESYMQADLIHPNATGEAYLASKWYDAIIAKGLCIDETAPTTEINQPSSAGVAMNNATFTGVADDAGSSGINRVQIAIANNAITTANKWFNFSTGAFDNIGSGCGASSPNNGCITNAALTNVSTDHVNWNIDLNAGNTQGHATLPAGDYTIYALAVDNAGNDEYHGRGLTVWPVNRTFLVDFTAPSANITNPASPGATLPPTPTLTGSATDNAGGAGVGRVAIALWSSTTASFVSPTGAALSGWASFDAMVPNGNPISANWSLATSLPTGSYTMTVYPFDAAGNYSAANKLLRAFSVTSSDNVAPTATITNPPSPGAALAVSPTLTGTATDNTGGSGIDRVSIALWSSTTGSFVSLNGLTLSGWASFDATVPNGNPTSASWSLPTNLPIGSYSMTVYPFDAAGNYSAANKLVRAFSVASPDNIAPTATITNPPSSGATLPLTPTLTGSVTDNTGGSGVDRVAIALWSNTAGSFVSLNGSTLSGWASFDAALPSGNPNTANWSLATSLPAGSYTMTLYPFDAAGNYSAANKMVRAFEVMFPDNIAPTATISNPAFAGATLSPSPTLTGSVTDNVGGSGVDRVAIALWSSTAGSFVALNGSTLSSWASFDATLPNGNPNSANWSLATSLPPGNYTLTAYPFDANGNYANRISRAFFVN